MYGMKFIPTVVFLAAMAFTNLVWGQRTGGSFGGSRWGATSNLSPSRPTPTYTRPSTSYRPTPTYTPRTRYTPTPVRINRPRGDTTPNVVAPIVIVNHSDDGDNNNFEYGYNNSQQEWGTEEIGYWLMFMGSGAILFVAWMIYQKRNHSRRSRGYRW